MTPKILLDIFSDPFVQNTTPTVSAYTSHYQVDWGSAIIFVGFIIGLIILVYFSGKIGSAVATAGR